MNTKSKGCNKSYDLTKAEDGISTIAAMVYCLAAIVFYLKGGKYLIENNLDPLYHLIVAISMGIITLATIGCTLQLLLGGNRSSGLLHREVGEENERLLQFVPEAKQQLDYLEEVARQCRATFRPRGQISMELAKRVVNAIDRRAAEVQRLLESHDKLAIIDAYELLHSDLEVVENCVNNLIPGDPIKPLPKDDWFAAVDSLLREASTELEQAAA